MGFEPMSVLPHRISSPALYHAKIPMHKRSGVNGIRTHNTLSWYRQSFSLLQKIHPPEYLYLNYDSIMELRGFEPLRSIHDSALAYILTAGRITQPELQLQRQKGRIRELHPLLIPVYHTATVPTSCLDYRVTN